MAGALEHLGVSYLAGQPNSDHDQLGHDLDDGALSDAESPSRFVTFMLPVMLPMSVELDPVPL